MPEGPVFIARDAITGKDFFFSLNELLAGPVTRGESSLELTQWRLKLLDNTIINL
jgi:hypothetical protein